MLRIAAALVLAAIACSDPHRDAQNRSAPMPPNVVAGSSAPVTFTLRHELIDYRRVADAAEAERVRAAWAATP